jgi:hypothetical protein
MGADGDDADDPAVEVPLELQAAALRTRPAVSPETAMRRYFIVFSFG